MRILSVSHYAPPHVGGLETLVDALASGLVRRGHEVTAVSSTAGLRDGLGAARSSPPEYRMIYVPALNKPLEAGLGVPYPVFSPSLLPVLRREIARADVVHVHGFLFQSSLVAQALARRTRHRPAVVLSEHVGHVPYESRVLDRLEAAAIGTLGRWSARASDAIVICNRRVEELIARLAPRTPLRWIDNGVDTEFFRPPSGSERSRLRRELGWDDRPRVLFGGRAVAKKGFDIALEAARRGQGAFRLAIIGTFRPPPGAPNVELLGLLSRERMAEALRAADALFVPARGEGLPITILEALASGLPTVGTDDPGYRAALTGFGAAVRLMPQDAASMTRVLMEVVSDPAARAAAEAGVELARRSFSVQACVSEHAQLYGELLEARARQGRHRRPIAVENREYFQQEHFEPYEGKIRYVRALAGLLQRHGVPSGRVLDVGSGFGFFLRAIEEAGYEPYGLEVSEYARDRAREYTSAPIAVQTAERDFPFETDYFDAITMFDVVEHIEDYHSMLKECKRTLRPGGRILIATPSAHSIARFMLGKRWSWHKDPTHVHMFSPRSLEEALREAGFLAVESTTYLNFYIVGDATTALRPLRRVGRFVTLPWIGDSLLAIGTA
jgi:D-inositol-3-phosphate glycosyltransferase